MSYIELKKRAKIPATEMSSAPFDDNALSFNGEFKAYLYWPLALVLIAISAASYLVGMYFAS